MLKPYDHLEAVMEENSSRQYYFESKLFFFASDIMNFLKIFETSEIDNSFNRAFQAYSTLNIPISINFKKVYRFDGENLITDWKLSSLACFLIIINCNPSNPEVAKAQLFFAQNRI